MLQKDLSSVTLEAISEDEARTRAEELFSEGMGNTETTVNEL